MAFSIYKHRQRGSKLYEIASIKEIIELGQFQLAMKKIHEFIDNYGNDIEVLYLYGKLLRKTGYVEESINNFKKALEVMQEKNTDFYYNATIAELFKVYFINCYYKEAYDILISAPSALKFEHYNDNMPNLSEFKKLLEIRLGFYKEQGDESVLIQKVLYYDRERSIDHVKKHLKESGRLDHSIFNDVDIDKLFALVEDSIKESKKMQRFAFNDLYMFEFYRIGQDNSNKLMVVTNKGTNEIISMYPTQSNIKCQINDNLYRQVLEEESSKVKKISQIDKFNKRYGLK